MERLIRNDGPFLFQGIIIMMAYADLLKGASVSPLQSIELVRKGGLF
jgi:hypothetical protein